MVRDGSSQGDVGLCTKVYKLVVSHNLDPDRQPIQIFMGPLMDHLLGKSNEFGGNKNNLDILPNDNRPNISKWSLGSAKAGDFAGILGFRSNRSHLLVWWNQTLNT
jgi:hypothetical protein